MPLEIKELHIKVNINPPNSNPSQGNQGTPSASSESAMNQQAIIDACIEQIMEILQEKSEA